jgi:flagellar biosynthetic protein FlhB
MSEEDKGQEKSHEPTEQRRKQFRDRGEVPKLKEVSGTIGLVVSVMCLSMFVQQMAVGIQDVFINAFSSIPEGDLSIPVVMDIANEFVTSLVFILAGPLIIMWLAAALTGLIQGRGVIPKDPIKFDLTKLNPLPGFKRIFMSSQPLVELAKGVIKLGLIGWMVWTSLEDQAGILPEMTYMTVEGLLEVHYQMAMLVVARALPIALIIAVLDYAYQWYQLQEKMMMTLEDIKEENKNTEGDPHLRAARKQRQREIANIKSVGEVRRADVVVTNPTHYAVAIRYRPEEFGAPIVVCKGVDHLAMKIKAEARKNDIPTIENRPLARALYAAAKVGEMIPEDLYGAVAQVIAVIMRRRRARQGHQVELSPR